jgi:transposase-like protein/IS1 family transposase
VIVASCPHEHSKRFGKDRYGHQRYRCCDCGKTWIESAPKLIGDMRLPLDKAIMCLKMLLEGSSIRSIERLTGVNRNTLMSLLVLVGERCRMCWIERMRNLPATDVQVDEVWGFVGCKEKLREARDYSSDFGDAYTFLGIERTTKLVLAYHVGKRDGYDARQFMQNLSVAVAGNFHLTTDGFKHFIWSVAEHLRGRVDFGVLVKIFRNKPGTDKSAYNPAVIKGLRRKKIMGKPDTAKICTSHSERLNRSLRTSIRRLTRLTNGHSKTWRNHEAAIALWLTWYNFGRVHSTIKTTPAVAAGITDSVWSVERMLTELATLN